MNKLPIFSQSSQYQSCKIIKAKFYNEITGKPELKESRSTAKIIEEEATVISILENKRVRTQEVKLRYTVKEGDNKRLKRGGVLRVYNMRQPMDIPLHKLLGKLNDTNIGITLNYINNEWQVEGGLAEQVTQKDQPFTHHSWRWIAKYILA